ncbi:PF07588 family protein [Leptospira wolbachii serovar Codice str. CDC]|uniref:PF07588 family protein n=1 Tax=Leptospira wolbachii serovar Codice str. CDC TaxID=1218599 RepID=R9ABN1_9LEPT|nr:PF07588 family protein [Leptospira wolbachii serovar Codice str. CDC]
MTKLPNNLSGFFTKQKGKFHFSISMIHLYFVFLFSTGFLTNCSSTPLENVCDVSSESFSKTILAKLILGDTSHNCVSMNISISISFTVGGKISGLTGSGLTLILNQKETLAIPPGSREFTFPIQIPIGSNYEVNFATQAEGNFCELKNATGKVTNRNIQDIEINCMASCIKCIIFITQNGYPANIGKASNFDSSCQSDPNYPGSGNFKAMVVDGISRRASITPNMGDGQIDWVFKANQAYIRPTGIPIETSNANGLFTTTISTPITTTSSDHWTGLESDWTTFYNGTRACLKWTTNSSSELGVVGDAYTQDILTLTAGKGLQQCSINRELVCVEQ